MRVVVAEKPSVARKIASILKADISKEGYFKGKGFAITWAFGHMVELAEPSDYGYQKKWILNELPIIPETFKLKPKSDKGANKQLSVIRGLFKEATEIINAADAGREGELIFRRIYNYINIDKPVKRFWVSNVTDNALKKGFENLIDSKEKDALYLAAKARSESDWIVGINATRALTLAVNSGTLFSLGRVQTATLRLVVDRSLAHTNFISQPLYTPYIEVEKIKLKRTESFKEKDQAISCINNIASTIDLEVIHTEENENAPLLFNLSALQIKANNQYGYTAKKTLDTTQKLYEQQLVSYPRTDSKYLNENQKDELTASLNNLGSLSVEHLKISELLEALDFEKNSAFNDSKVSDHHAIIPTGIEPKLFNSEAEEHIYNLILKQTLTRFLPACKKRKTNIVSNNPTGKYLKTGYEIAAIGWRVLDPQKDIETLPRITSGHKPVDHKGVLEGKTTAPPLFTDATLIIAMLNSGKNIDEDLYSEAIKGKGIGTEPTRSGIIETIIQRNYIYRNKRQLFPNPTAITLIQSLGELSITSPELTGEMEYKLHLIEESKEDYTDFMNYIKAYTLDLLPKLIAASDSISITDKKENQKNQILCPKCNTGVIYKSKNKLSYYCSLYKNDDKPCDFSFYGIVAKKKISDVHIYKLLTDKHTGLIKGFLSKKGSKFDAKLQLDDNFKIVFDIPAADKIKTFGTCPKCQKGTLKMASSGVSVYCDQFKSGCRFSLFKNINERKMSDDELKALLKDGKTTYLEGFKSKKGLYYGAILYLDDSFKVKFNFKK